MPFYKYRPVKQFGRYNTKSFKQQLRAKLNEDAPPFIVPQALIDKGIRIWDPVKDIYLKYDPQRKNWIPEDEPGPAKPVFREEVQDRVFDGREPFAEGAKQASVLTKSLLYSGLPEKVLLKAANYNVDSQKERLERLLMHAERYDTTFEKLPKRPDPNRYWWNYPRYWGIPLWRKHEIILDGLHALVNRTALEPHVRRRRIPLREAVINASFARGEEQIRYTNRISTPFIEPPKSRRNEAKKSLDQVMPDVVYTPEDLPPVRLETYSTHGFVLDGHAPAAIMDGKSTIDQPLPDIHPIKASIDCVPEDGTAKDLGLISPASISIRDTPLNLRTIMVGKPYDYKYPWSQPANEANLLMHTFGAALANARQRYGVDFHSDLPQPIVVTGVQICRNVVDFSVVQLNTLATSSDEGVKNVLWLDGGNEFYELLNHWENPERIEALNLDVLRKFAAVLSYE